MAKGKPRGGASAQQGALASVRVRFANEGTMAKGKGKSKKGGSSKRPRKGNPGKKNPRRRRRNPEGIMGALGSLLGAGAVALASGAAVLYAQNKWAQPTTNASTGASTPNNAMLYGIPAAGVLLAAMLAKKAPTIAAGLATGSIAGPFALPLFSKVSTASSSTTPAAVTAASTTKGLSAVQLGALAQLGAVQLGRASTFAAHGY